MKNATCIVGIQEGDTVYIGGDSAGYAGNRLELRRDTKVFEGKRAIIYGCTSSFRMIQLLRYRFDPGPLEGDDLSTWMVDQFIERLRRCFKNHGYATVDNNVESGGRFLVGVAGTLYQVYSDYQVAQYLDGFTATGSGEEYALGSLYSTHELYRPSTRIQKALSAAARYCPSVEAPFHGLSAQYEAKDQTVISQLEL